MPRGRTAVTLRSQSLSFTDRLVHRRTCRSRSSRVPPPRLCHAHLVALPIRPPSATARFALKRVAALVPDGQRQRCRTALPLDGAHALLSIAGSLLLEVPMSSLLPTFRVAYIVRDAQGVSRGGAVQLRAANADAAGRAARAMRRDVVSFEIVAVAAL